MTTATKPRLGPWTKKLRELQAALAEHRKAMPHPHDPGAECDDCGAVLISARRKQMPHFDSCIAKGRGL